MVTRWRASGIGLASTFTSPAIEHRSRRRGKISPSDPAPEVEPCRSTIGTRVDAGLFHDFHQTWVIEIKKTLNAGLLPSGYYALAEQVMGGGIPDVVSLERPATDDPLPSLGHGLERTAVAPAVRFIALAELAARQAGRAVLLAVRHISRDCVVAMVEIVSPGNKHNRRNSDFVGKSVRALEAGIHLLIVDLFPPGPGYRQGIHRAIWDDIEPDHRFVLPASEPLTLASYIGGPCPEALVEFAAVGQSLPDRPLFLTEDIHVPVPLEATYRLAFDAVPTGERGVLEALRQPMSVNRSAIARRRIESLTW